MQKWLKNSLKSTQKRYCLLVQTSFILTKKELSTFEETKLRRQNKIVQKSYDSFIKTLFDKTSCDETFMIV